MMPGNTPPGRCLALLLLVLIAGMRPASGQAPSGPGTPVSRPKKSMTALFTPSPIRLDAVMDEPIWKEAQPATGFVQREPKEGAPDSEGTEIRAVYDKEALYFGVSAFDREPGKVVINDLIQDFPHTNSDMVSVCLDTFDDDRNAFCFYVNPAGAMKEIQSVDEGRDQNLAWEDVWDAQTAIRPNGWFAEIRIPFKSLRFPIAETQHWGINFMRRIRRKNEQADWSPMPRRFTHTHVSFAGDLRGIEGVRPGRNVKVKPFVTGQLGKIRTDDVDSAGDAGLDVKYGLTSGLTLDASLNTDFSQAEVDEQQVNLTRFNLFFPEKRDFFLENAGMFLFGQTDERNGEREIIPFFSRRIGLSSTGQPLPILGGARVSGRVGPYSVGMLDMHTRDAALAPASNFAVVRLKRNVLRQSSIGGLWVNRQGAAGDYNRTFGLDANFSFMRKLNISSFLVGTRTPGLKGDDGAGRLWMEWKTNQLEARSGYLVIGRNFNAEVGFVPRVGIRKSDSQLGWRSRPKNPLVREFFPNVRVQYITDPGNRLLTRITEAEVQGELHDGGSLTVGRRLTFERLDETFRLRRTISVPPGDYPFDESYFSFSSNPAAHLSGNAKYTRGDFWNGRRQSWTLGLNYHPHYKFNVSVRYNWDQLRFPKADVTSRLVTLRVNHAFSRKMFLNALIQYNSDLRQVSTNLRFNLIHRPLSDIFVVYNEQRDAFQRGQTDKVLSIKYTHMLDMF